MADYQTLMDMERHDGEPGTFRVKNIYVDIAGDLNAGMLLGQIIYWNLPSKGSKRSKLRARKNGKLWLAKKRTDWWDEVRLTAKQFDRAIGILEEKGLVTKEIYKFNDTPTCHIWLDENRLCDEFNRQIIRSSTSEKEIRCSPKGKMEIPQRSKSLTETTTKINKEKGANSDECRTYPHPSDFMDLCNETEDTITYYRELFHSCQGREHPRLTKDLWERVIDVIESSMHSMTPDEWQRVIDQHFHTAYQDGCDFRIQHFISGRIIELRKRELQIYS